MKQELREYIKRCIIAEQQQKQDNSIIKNIVKKFSIDYEFSTDTEQISADFYTFSQAIDESKRGAFYKYARNMNEIFKNRMNNSYIHSRRDIFDFWLPWDELREYLKPELQQAELLLIEVGRASAVKIGDISSALEIAENIGEFEEMVKMSAKT